MSKSCLNEYGDELISTTGAHGADVASQRLDKLDKDALEQVLSLENPRITCVDLGCGFGWQGVRLALLGASAHLFDLLPESRLVASLRGTTGLALSYLQHDLRSLAPESLPAQVDLAFSQRFIHYLTYSEAQRLIHLVSVRMPAGSYFYLSASGLDSELGNDYAAAGSDLSSRFSPLSPHMQVRHGIHEPVCLYTEAELSALMRENHFAARKVWKSLFGNVKGVFQKDR